MIGGAMLTIRQVVFPRPRQVLIESVDVEWPTPEPAMLIRTARTVISTGTELSFYLGNHVALADPSNKWAKYPFHPGYAACGRIEQISGAVPGRAVGDRVFLQGPHADWQIVKVSEERNKLFTPIPDGLSDQHAVFARLMQIAWASLLRCQFSPGDLVAVIGAGVIGSLAAQVFKVHGAKVVLVDRVSFRLEKAKACGIADVLCASDEAAIIAGINALFGRQPDIVVEATGAPGLIPVALHVARRLGQVVVLGAPRERVDLDAYHDIFYRGVRLIGAHEYHYHEVPAGLPDRAELAGRAMDLLSADKANAQPLLTHTVKADQADTAYRLLSEQPEQALAVQLDWT
jgi:2-desacetyl-2-hydroxyethyl bacteriochlorophyllide A dehydrogenase